MSTDLYKRLNLERSASSVDIKKAFQRLALQHHPDKGGNEETFKEIRQAYDILSDEGKRRHYDATGQIPGEQIEGHPGGGMPFPFPFDIGNLFGMFGGGGRPGGGRPRGHKAPPKREPLKLTLAQLYFGHNFQIHLDRNKACTTCAGSGAKRKEPCGSCGGSGVAVQTMNLGGMIMQSQGPCGNCAGEGSRIIESCGACNGTKRMQEKKVLDVRVAAGTQDGEIFSFPEVCSEVPEFEKAGDLQLTVETQGSGWKRTGNVMQHLETEVVLNLAEALVGTKVRLEGHPGYDEGLYVDVPPASFQDDVYCITGQGMPLKGTTNAYGDLHLRIKIAAKLSERKELGSEAVQGALKSAFGSMCRQLEVPADADVQKELYLTKLS